MTSVNPILIGAFDKFYSWENLLKKASVVVQKANLMKIAQKVEQDLYLYGNSFLRVTPSGAEVLDPATVILKANVCK